MLAAPVILPLPLMLKLLALELFVITEGATGMLLEIVTVVCTPPTESSNKTVSACLNTSDKLVPRLSQLAVVATSQLVSEVEFHFRLAALPPTDRLTCPALLALSVRV